VSGRRKSRRQQDFDPELSRLHRISGHLCNSFFPAI